MRYKIYKDGIEINVIIADEDFVTNYCKENGFTYAEDILDVSEPIQEELTQLDAIEAQVTYTAMMTDTLLEV